MRCGHIILIALVFSAVSQSAAVKVNGIIFKGEITEIDANFSEYTVSVSEPAEIDGVPYMQIGDTCEVTFEFGIIDRSLNVGDQVEVFGLYLRNNNDPFNKIHFINLYGMNHYIMRGVPGYINFTEEVEFEYMPSDSNMDQTPAFSNQPPSMIGLSPSVSGPQEVGASIAWTAQATDPENDPLYYQFWISGPRTGEEWQMVQDWSQSSTWTWWTAEGDVGTFDVQVRIRDGLHANSSDMDDFNELYDYEIKMRPLANLNVEVTNAVYSESDRRVYYCQEGKYFYVKNRVYLTGSDIDKVTKVTYYLHKSFPNPVQVSTDRGNDFEIWIWTWGRFPIRAEIETDSGQVFEKSYEFSFKSKYEEAKSRGIPMVREC